MDKRSMARVMFAASSVKTTNDRQACIIGGIVRSVMDVGKFDPQYASHAAAVLMGKGREMIQSDSSLGGPLGVMRRLPDARRPTHEEMRPLVEAYVREYKRAA